MNDDDHLAAIDAAVKRAELLMEGADLIDASVDEQEEAWEDRNHCGTCMVRTVMEQVWPAVDNYITYLQSKAAE